MSRRLIELPSPRGPLSEQLFEALEAPPDARLEAPERLDSVDPIADDDLQLALYVAYELHYTAIRRRRRRLGVVAGAALLPRRAGAPLRGGGRGAGRAGHAGRSSSRSRKRCRRSSPRTRARRSRASSRTRAREEQMREHVVHRSAYQLKEADPHSWAIPRLGPGPKAALLEVQFDEYGGGNAERMHSVLFAKTMEGLGLDAGLRGLPGPLARGDPGDGQPGHRLRPAPAPPRRPRRSPRRSSR